MMIPFFFVIARGVFPMKPYAVQAQDAPQAIGPYSHAMVASELVFTSGQIPVNPATGTVVEGDISAQTEQVLKNLSAVLAAAGSSPNSVLKTTCFLSDMADFAAFNTVYARCFSAKPARSCVAVKALPMGVLVEVEAIAIKED